jgi:IclR family KDG regulon transcriptional repressor
VERLESHHMLPIFLRIGHRLAAHCTSSGKVLLAALPRDELRRRLDGVRLRARTPRTITDMAVLIAELDRVAGRGWASNIEEGEPGITSVGAPLYGADGRVIAAVSVVGASARVSGDTMRRYTTQVVEAGWVISRRLGYRAPVRSRQVPVATDAYRLRD